MGGVEAQAHFRQGARRLTAAQAARDGGSRQSRLVLEAVAEFRLAVEQADDPARRRLYRYYLAISLLDLYDATADRARLDEARRRLLDLEFEPDLDEKLLRTVRLALAAVARRSPDGDTDRPLRPLALFGHLAGTPTGDRAPETDVYERPRWLAEARALARLRHPHQPQQPQQQQRQEAGDDSRPLSESAPPDPSYGGSGFPPPAAPDPPVLPSQAPLPPKPTIGAPTPAAPGPGVPVSAPAAPPPREGSAPRRHWWQRRVRDEAPRAVGARPPGTRVVHPRLEAPAQLVAGDRFSLIVGLSDQLTARVVATSEFSVPNAAFRLRVSLMLHGFRTADASTSVRELVASSADPYPAAVVNLIAVDDDEFTRARTILATYDIDGVILGTASTSIEVVPRDEAPVRGFATTPPPPRPRPVPGPETVGWSLPVEGNPDVVITIARGNDQAARALQWQVTSPHQYVPATAGFLAGHLDPGAAGDWAQRVMRGVENSSDDQDRALYLQGVENMVGDQVPPHVWRALQAAATAVPHPAVLLCTDEPYIPWELATVPDPWDPTRPAILGAQVEMGRWTYSADGRTPSPAPLVPVSSTAVVTGVFGGSARLPEAEAEGRHLVATYGATPVEATLPAVIACLRGDPPADAVHFATHGRFDRTGTADGILMNDRSTLRPESIRGLASAAGPRPAVVFLNACQVGQMQEMLGDLAGVVPSFIRVGAQAVIAPLWKVDDTAARLFAERFYAALHEGRGVAAFFAEERARAAAPDTVGSPDSTVLAYLFFGHPRLTIG